MLNTRRRLEAAENVLYPWANAALQETFIAFVWCAVLAASGGEGRRRALIERRRRRVSTFLPLWRVLFFRWDHREFE